MSQRDTWVRLTPREWQHRLEAARAAALALVAQAGLDTDRETHNPATLICEGEIGPALRPGLDVGRKALKDQLARASARGDEFHGLDDSLMNHEIQIVEASYLFGVIVGHLLPWPLIAAMPAPYAPPRKFRRTKGAAR